MELVGGPGRALIRIVRQGYVRTTRERWYLRGLVQVVTHPLHLWDEPPAWFVEARGGPRTALSGADATGDPPASAATALVPEAEPAAPLARPAG